VRAGRRLRQTGALAVRAGVFALPDSSEGRAALEHAARELARDRGAALPCVLTWLDARDDERLRTRFERQQRQKRERLLGHIAVLERMLAASARGADPARRTAGARLARLRRQLGPPEPAPSGAAPPARVVIPSASIAGIAYRGRTWVTRKGVLVDRIASAWLIARFIDPGAQFGFVGPNEPSPEGALRFDMAEANFGHEHDRCTFETLVNRFRGGDPALRQIAEIVHDLDLKDQKYGRSEAPGVAGIIAGLAAAEPDDRERVRQGQWLFDCLYVSLRPGPTPRPPKGVLP
jgi:hypothetical protein